MGTDKHNARNAVNALKQYKELHHMSLHQLSEHLGGCSCSMISNWISGRYNPGKKSIERIERLVSQNSYLDFEIGDHILIKDFDNHQYHNIGAYVKKLMNNSAIVELIHEELNDMPLERCLELNNNVCVSYQNIEKIKA